jgi:hypothetical protein
MKPLSYVGDIDILILIDCREFLKISILNWIVSKSIAVIDVALSLDRLLTPNQINNCVTGIRYFRLVCVPCVACLGTRCTRFQSTGFPLLVVTSG